MTDAPTCATCGAELIDDSDGCPACAAETPVVRETAPVFLLVMLLCSSFLLFGSSFVTVSAIHKAAPPKLENLDHAAYAAARQFVNQRFPRAKGFSEFSQSVVERNGTQFSVMIAVDDITAGGVPVRNFLQVRMEFSGGDWELKEIKQ